MSSSRRHDPDGPLRFSRVLSHLGAMVLIALVLGLLAGGLAIPYVAALGVTSKTAARDIQQLPEALETSELAQSSRMVDDKGRTIATFFDENRKTVTRKQISPKMIDALIAVEDYRFYQHGALDLQGTLRAFLRNQASGGTVQGGSSITQQLAKLELLAQADTDEARAAATADSYARKIKELRHAIAFEQNYSKDWILTRYLNMANFGDRAWGIEAAAQHYFSTSAADLELGQAALLAGLVKNPTNYNPTEYPEDARIRRDVVLDQMAKYGKISDAMAERLKKRPLGLKVQKIRNGCQVSREPLFCDYVLNYLLQDESLGETRDDRLRLIQTGGLTIKATMDSRFQDAADAATADYVNPTDQAVGALAMVEPGTGKVKAISQSRPAGQKRELGQTTLNFAIPTELGKAQSFQGGSTFKAFVLAAALEQGVSPRTTYTVPAVGAFPENSFRTCNGFYPPSTDPVWTPDNFDLSGGTYDLYTGTQQSVNTFYGKLEQRTGLCAPYRLAKKMGIELTQPNQGEMVPSFTLGVAAVSPLELSEAYATFAARGVHCASQPVSEVLNNAGKVFKTYKKSCSRVMSQNTADTVNAILAGVMAPGGFGQNIAPSVPSAGKTGTINDNAAVWFSGYTPDLAMAAVIGGANSNGLPTTLNYQTVGGIYIGSRASGSAVAGPMWEAAMDGVVPFLAGDSFDAPGTSTSSEEDGSVPSTVGMSTAEAQQALSEAGFTPVVGPTIDSRQAPGIVAGQNPDGGANAPQGSTVTIFPSNGANFDAAPAPGGGDGSTSNASGPGRGNGNGRGGGNGNG